MSGQLTLELDLELARSTVERCDDQLPNATLDELLELQLDLEGWSTIVREAIDAELEHEHEPAVPVLAAHSWRTNAELIADVAELYLDRSWRILDPTFGRGIWWNAWAPSAELGGELVTHDLRIDGTDFRELPHDDATFDAVAFDPPYVAAGGRATSTLGARRGPVENGRGPLRRTREGSDFHDRYGMTEAPNTPAGVQQLIDDGLAEAARVVRPGGVVLVKCQDYVSSGKLWPGTHLTLTRALELDLELVDRLEHLAGKRPQPPGRRQVHARRNLSTLFVLRRRGGRRG